MSCIQLSPGYVPLPEEESVAIRADQKDFIRDEIKQQLGLAIDENFKPHGWRRAAFLLRELGPIASTIAIIVTLLGITLAAVYYSVANVKEETRFRTTTETRLGNIDESLKGMRADLAKQALINHASLPLSDFKATLPDLSSAITTAKRQNAKVSSKVIEDLQQKLTDSTNAPGFWPTAAEFISYRSLIVSQALPSNLPDCADRAPEIGKVTDIERRYPPKFSFEIPSYEGCKLTLDALKDTEKINWILTNKMPFLSFKHCLIVYRGGPINLITAVENKSFVVQFRNDRFFSTFSGNTVNFTDCIFDFSFTTAPPSDGQQVTQTVLTQNGASIDLLLKKPATHS
jgi:hypothetical protein